MQIMNIRTNSTSVMFINKPANLITMYDVIIVGGGPAGLGSAIYASRYNLKVLIITELIGGQIALSSEIENYPGTIKESGMKMMEEWKKHAEEFGTKVIQTTVKEITKEGDVFKVTTSKETYEAKTLLYATGAHHKNIGVPGEDEFQSKGVSYCPTCDGMFFKDKTVAVVGGGDAALRGTQVMLQYAKKVYLIHRRDEFRGEPILIERIKKDPKSELVLKRTVKEIKGENTVNSIVLDNDQVIEVDGIFIEIGSIPNTELIKNLNVELVDGLIKSNEDQSTNIPGLFAAGDVTTGSNKFRQVLTAASEGAIAAESIFEYIKKQDN